VKNGRQVQGWALKPEASPDVTCSATFSVREGGFNGHAINQNQSTEHVQYGPRTGRVDLLSREIFFSTAECHNDVNINRPTGCQLK